MKRPAAVGVAVAAAAVLAGATSAPASDRRTAVDAVRALITRHAYPCGVSIERLRATRLGDPLDLARTFAYRIDAQIGRGRTTAFAAWEVAGGVAVPVSPLAGEIERGCPLRDPVSAGRWRSLPYLDYDSGDLDVTTSTAWSDARAGTVIASTSRPLWAQPLQWIWSPTCSARRATFSRTLFLPGRPSSAAIAFRTKHVHSLQLFVNGRVASSVPGRGGYRMLAAPSRQLFRYGANVVTLAASRDASAPCGDVGVAAELTGRFRADLGLPPSRRFVIPGTHREGDYLSRRVTGAASGEFDFTVVNAGPSAIPAATFVAHVGAGAPLALVLPGRHCRRRDATSRLAPPYGTLCVLRNVRSGSRIRLRVVYHFRPRQLPVGEEETYLTWEVQGPWDANPHNQQHTVTLTFRT